MEWWRAIFFSILVLLAILFALYGVLVVYADRVFDRALSEVDRVRRSGDSRGAILEEGEEAEGGTREFRVSGPGGTEAIGLRGPITRGEEPLLRVLLFGGIGTGKNAARLVPAIDGVELYAFDYHLKQHLPRGNVFAKAAALPSVIDGIAETLVAFAYAERALAGPDAGEGPRTVLVGVSLGVPFAAALAATGGPPDAVALLYSGADIGPIIAEALPSGPPFLRSAMGAVLGRLLSRLDPARTVGRIAPAPLLLVNAAADPRIPERSVRALHEAARGPKKVVLLEGGHVLPEKEELLGILAGEVVTWLREIGFLPVRGGEGPGPG